MFYKTPHTRTQKKVGKPYLMQPLSPKPQILNPQASALNPKPQPLGP